jgi:hypothetical protein
MLVHIVAQKVNDMRPMWFRGPGRILLSAFARFESAVTAFFRAGDERWLIDRTLTSRFHAANMVDRAKMMKHGSLVMVRVLQQDITRSTTMSTCMKGTPGCDV